MKTYQMSKQELEFLSPVHAQMTAMQMAINVYIVNSVFPRMGIAKDAKARYDIIQGTLTVIEPEDEAKADTVAKPEVKPEPKPEEPKN